MKTLLKSLIVWLMLLAIPFQGVAAATMLVCAPMPPMPPMLHIAVEASSVPHDHQAMLATAASGEHHHPGGKCASRATCCCGAAMAPSCAALLLAEVQHRANVSSEPARIASVDLALPERPPQASLT